MSSCGLTESCIGDAVEDDAVEDDPSIIACVRRSARWGLLPSGAERFIRELARVLALEDMSASISGAASPMI
jgi:hypothetical protein